MYLKKYILMRIFPPNKAKYVTQSIYLNKIMPIKKEKFHAFI